MLITGKPDVAYSVLRGFGNTFVELLEKSILVEVVRSTPGASIWVLIGGTKKSRPHDDKEVDLSLDPYDLHQNFRDTDLFELKKPEDMAQNEQRFRSF